MLELTETPSGDVLEQLLVITHAEATTWDCLVPAGMVNRIRLVTQIDSELPGVPASVRARLELAALSGMAQLARLRTGATNDERVPVRALWRQGRLHELLSHSFADGVTSLLHQASPPEGDVLLVFSNSSLAAVFTMVSNLDLLYPRSRENVARGLQESQRASSEGQSISGLFVGSAGPHEISSEAARQTLLDAAAQRELLAEDWPSAAQVSAQLGRNLHTGSLLASDLRREDKLLGVYVTHPLPSYRYPRWQFRPDGQPVDHLSELLEVLREFGPFQREADGLRRSTGWGEVEWFLSPHALLDGATPAATLAVEPLRVLRAARAEFESDT